MAQLTNREVEILQSIVDGNYSVNAIAERHIISRNTVKTYLSIIYKKLGVKDRTQAVLAALRLGLVELNQPKEQ